MKKEKRLMPDLRFPEFKEEWEWLKLEEMAKIERGKFSPRPRNNPIYYNGEIPFVQTGDVVNSNGIIRKYSQTLNEKGLKVSKLFPKGSILITIAANIGYAGVLNEDMACPDSLIGIICKNNINNWFLNYLFQIEQPKMEYLAVAAAQKNINLDFLKPYIFNIPSLPEQHKIANFLTAIDTRLQSLEKKKGLLEEYKKGVMQKIFKQEIRFKDEDGENFPEWMEKRLGEVAIKKSSNIAANKIEDNFGDYIIYGAAGILKRVDFYEEKNDYIGIVKDGAGVGRVSYCEGKSSVLATMDIIKPKKNINTYFLYCLLEQINYRIYITGSTIPHIYFKDYKIERVGVPSQEEQTKIANFLSAIDDKIGLASKQIEKTEAYKKVLLQQLFV